MKLEQVRRLAMALPGVTEEPHFDDTSFRVGGKIFATAPPGGERLHVFVEEEERQVALGLAPDAMEPLTWGKRVFGLRITLSTARPAMVKSLLRQAWTRRASKRPLASASQPDQPAKR